MTTQDIHQQHQDFVLIQEHDETIVITDNTAEYKWFRDHVERSQQSGEIFAVSAHLTPVLAAILLEHNKTNRPIGRLVLERYTNDIASGRWQYNGEPLIISATGELNDGQHRCLAVITARKPIKTLIVFGVTRESRFSLDTGIKRTVGQHLSMGGHTNSSVVSSATNYILMLQKHKFIADGSRYRSTPAEVMEWANAHPEIHEEISSTLKIGREFKLSYGLMAALRHTFNLISRPDADEFFKKFESWANLAENDPIFLLRKRLDNNKSSKSKLPTYEIAGIVIKTWNYFRKGRTLKQLSRRTRGEARETFPIPE